MIEDEEEMQTSKGNLCFDGAIWEIYGFRYPTLWNMITGF